VKSLKTIYIRKYPNLFIFLFTLLFYLPGPIELSADQMLRKVRLSYPDKARSVCVAGDFNQWSREQDCMQAAEIGWTLTLLLKPGIYRYMFIVDGSRWVGDPGALWGEEDGFGRKNSVLLVK
jgi:hypothetical protein